MKHYSETVLNGHPDKFCDLLADRIVREVWRIDAEGYAQVEAAVWSDQLFLTGAIAMRSKTKIDIRHLLIELGAAIGYTAGNHIDASRYQLHDHICYISEDPLQWTRHVNDQCIITGYAGYDGLTNWLPPEHYGCWHFRAALTRAIAPGGTLAGHGPDGKVLVVVEEDAQGFRIHTLLVTLQQHPSCGYVAFTEALAGALYDAYQQLAAADPRWHAPWKDIRVLINPNGPFLRGGSDSDNGQTGRKLVMDFYGPRIPIGGGAIYGKHPSHIDRLGAFAARNYALQLVENGATEAQVNLCFAPGMDAPLDVTIRCNKKTGKGNPALFHFEQLRQSQLPAMDYRPDALGTFYQPAGFLQNAN